METGSAIQMNRDSNKRESSQRARSVDRIKPMEVQPATSISIEGNEDPSDDVIFKQINGIFEYVKIFKEI